MINVGITVEFPVDVWKLFCSFLENTLENYVAEIKNDPVFLELCKDFKSNPNPDEIFTEIISSIQSELADQEDDDISISLDLFFWYQIHCVLELQTRFYENCNALTDDEKKNMIQVVILIIEEIDIHLDGVES